jgi:hypothetical protein
MAALSDYLESGLLTHIFKGTSFVKPAEVAIALTSSVPLDSDTGVSIPELPSGTSRGNTFISTNYKRISLFNPATSGDTLWNNVGVDELTTYAVSGTSSSGNSIGLNGYFYPLYLNRTVANSADTGGASKSWRFKEFPNVVLFAPVSLQESGKPTNPGYTLYEGNGFIRNTTQLVFDTALTDWGWVSGVAVVDTSNYASGNLLMYAELENPRYVYAGDNIKFDVNSLEISLK